MPEAPAVVLKTVDYGEADRIVTLLAEPVGKLRGIARSARSSRRRFSPGLESGTHGVVTYRERPRSELAIIESLSAGRAFAAASADLLAYAIGQLALEVADALTVEGQPSPRTFHALVATLDPPSGKVATPAYAARYLVVALTEAGYAPTLERCTRCDVAPARDAHVDRERVGTACRACLPASAAPVDVTRAASVALALAGCVEHVIERPLATLAFLREQLASSVGPG